MLEDDCQWRLDEWRRSGDLSNPLLPSACKGEERKNDDSSDNRVEDVWQGRMGSRSMDSASWYGGALNSGISETNNAWHDVQEVDNNDDSSHGSHHDITIGAGPDNSASQDSLSHHCNTKLYECGDCGLLSLSSEVLIKHQENEVHPPLHLPSLRCPASSCPNIFHSPQSLKVHLALDHRVSTEELDPIVSFALDKCRPSPLPSISVGEIKKTISIDKARESNNERDESQEPRTKLTEVSDTLPLSAPPGWKPQISQSTVSEESEDEAVPLHEEDLAGSSSDESDVDTDSDLEIPTNDLLDTTESIKKHIDLMNLIKKQKTTAHRCLMSVKCRLRFKSLNTLDYHKKCHDLAKKCWKCPECSFCFSVWNSLALHLWNEHTIDMELYYCNLCSFRTPNLSQLKTNHMWIHSGLRRFTCPSCSKSVKTRKQLRNHQAVHKKTGRGRYECKGCRALFSRRSLLRQHHLTVHQNTRNYRCTLCPHRSASRSAHDLHFRKHTKEKKYACGECNYTTGDHNALRRHLATHSGHRPYSCPHCSYTSIHSTSLRAHLNSKHPGMLSDVVFSCPLCPFSSLRKDLFVSHTASKHSLHSPLLTSLSQNEEGNCSSSISTAGVGESG